MANSLTALELPADIDLPESVTAQLNMRLLWIGKQLANANQATTNTVSSAVIVGTAAERGILEATSQNSGTQFIESDTGLTYVARGIVAGSPANVWWYLAGMKRGTRANRPTTLAAFDVGLLYFVTDFSHVLRWTGTSWERGPGDTEHSDTFHMVAAAPSEPGWHACDGSLAVNFLKYDGTLGARDLPNTAGTAAFPKFGAAYAAAITAATVPTLAMAPYTPAGTISAPALTMNSYTPAGTNSIPIFTGTAATITKAATFAATGAVTALTAFNGSTTTYTPLGTISAPTFTGTPATLTGTVAVPVFTGTAATLTGTISLPGDPVASFAMILAYRQ